MWLKYNETEVSMLDIILQKKAYNEIVVPNFICPMPTATEMQLPLKSFFEILTTKIPVLYISGQLLNMRKKNINCEQLKTKSNVS
jgi:hypothetical protein